MTRPAEKSKNVLIAGVGNVLRGDDGFGPYVIKILSSKSVPENVELRDFGSAALSIAIELGDYDYVIFVDAVKRRGEPGTLYVLDLDTSSLESAEIERAVELSLHELDLSKILALASSIGALPRAVTIIGCEPKTLDVGLGLSEEVLRAAERAAELCLEKVREKLGGGVFSEE